MIKEDGDGPDSKNVFKFDKDDAEVLTIDNKVRFRVLQWLLLDLTVFPSGQTHCFRNGYCVHTRKLAARCLQTGRGFDYVSD